MAAAGAVKKPMTFDEAWPILQEEAINKLTDSFEHEGLPNRQPFTSEEYMRLYTVVYSVSSSEELQKLYDHYKRAFEDYISSKVLPSLRGKENEDLLRELLRRWNNHKTMTYWLSRFFNFLSRYFIPINKLPSLEEAGHVAFYNLVYSEVNDGVSDAIVSLIDRERGGEQIDSAVVKEVLDIYKKLGEIINENKLEHNVKDLEEALTKALATFYSRKASDWNANMSYEDYMLKVEECLDWEKLKACDYYTGFASEDKVLKVVKHELLTAMPASLKKRSTFSDGVA